MGDKKKMLDRICDELKCTICTEVFIDPTSLKCGHIYCKFCLEGWRKGCNDDDEMEFNCPCCRAEIVSEDRNLYLDNLVKAVMKETNETLKQHRKELVEQRNVKEINTTNANSINTGILTWFNNTRGFGFIKQDDDGEDVFVHCSEIPSHDAGDLMHGQKVEYKIEILHDGRLRANNVTGPNG